MAGQLKVDSINADSNLALKIANTAVAFVDSTGLKMTGSSLQFSSGGSLTVAANNALVNPTITTPTINQLSSAAATALTIQSAGTTAVTIDTSQNVGIGTSSPTTAADIVRSNTSGNDNQMPNLFVRNTSATQGNGSSTFNQAAVSVFAGNSTVTGGIRAAYDSAGSYGTGVQFYVNSTNPLQFYTNGSERMRIDSSGKVLIGTTATDNPTDGIVLYYAAQNSQIIIGHATGTPSGYNFVKFDYNASAIGSITQNGTTAVAYNTSSDYRLKENIAPITGALNKVAQLKPVTYTWKSAPDETGEGFIAHELAEVCPQAVHGTKDAVDADGNPVYQGIDTSFLVATLTAALQETKALIDQQAETINALTARIVALENK